MDYYEFTDLDDRGKAFAVWHYGIFLMTRYDQDYKVKLYALGDFYVEVLHPMLSSTIVGMRSFKQLDYLEPYFDLLEIDELITAS